MRAPYIISAEGWTNSCRTLEKSPKSSANKMHKACTKQRSAPQKKGVRRSSKRRPHIVRYCDGIAAIPPIAPCFVGQPRAPPTGCETHRIYPSLLGALFCNILCDTPFCNTLCDTQGKQAQSVLFTLIGQTVRNGGQERMSKLGRCMQLCLDAVSLLHSDP